MEEFSLTSSSCDKEGVKSCITINKAQGQMFDRVEIYLPEPVFSHGQLHVGLYCGKTLRLKLNLRVGTQLMLSGRKFHKMNTVLFMNSLSLFSNFNTREEGFLLTLKKYWIPVLGDRTTHGPYLMLKPSGGHAWGGGQSAMKATPN